MEFVQEGGKKLNKPFDHTVKSLLVLRRCQLQLHNLVAKILQKLGLALLGDVG